MKVGRGIRQNQWSKEDPPPLPKFPLPPHDPPPPPTPSPEHPLPCHTASSSRGAADSAPRGKKYVLNGRGRQLVPPRPNNVLQLLDDRAPTADPLNGPEAAHPVWCTPLQIWCGVPGSSVYGVGSTFSVFLDIAKIEGLTLTSSSAPHSIMVARPRQLLHDRAPASSSPSQRPYSSPPRFSRQVHLFDRSVGPFNSRNYGVEYQEIVYTVWG